MPFFEDQHSYLHQSSLLIQAYPSARITTKYSLPRKPNSKAKSKSKNAPATTASESTGAGVQPKREPSAVLTLKTFHPESGICLKYRTEKAAEVGRLLNGLGRLAKGEIIEMPTVTSAVAGGIPIPDGDKMEVDSGVAVPKVEDRVATATPAAAQTSSSGGGGGGGGKSKKKKGKK